MGENEDGRERESGERVNPGVICTRAQVCGVNISRGKFSYDSKILRTRRAPAVTAEHFGVFQT